MALRIFFENVHGYALHIITAVPDALGITRRQNIDVAIVDLTLATEVQARLGMIRLWRRESFQFPVIATSAQDYDGLSIETFEAGVDDFVRKPYLIGELLARIQRHLIRASSARPNPSRIDGLLLPIQPFNFAGATVSPDLRLQFPSGKVIKLGAKHVGILREFHRHQGTLLLKDNLVHAVWGADANTNSASVHQYLHILRKFYRSEGIDLNSFVFPESKAGWRIVSAIAIPAAI